MKHDLAAIARTFPREVPVFPLAESVLFPGAVLPLHIFEPRYRTMVGDLVAGEGLVAMALLQQCSRDEYRTLPPFHATVCVGRLITHQPLAGGRSNISLLGVSAGRATPVESEAPYRVAEVALLADAEDAEAGWYGPRVERALGKSLSDPDALPMLLRQLQELLDEARIPAALINTCAFTAPILPRHKLELLEERSLRRRLERLLDLLDRSWQWN